MITIQMDSMVSTACWDDEDLNTVLANVWIENALKRMIKYYSLLCTEFLWLSVGVTHFINLQIA